jgi:HD-GYP domain-containing protein (c-di-GMP phosphodiesterase class II)
MLTTQIDPAAGRLPTPVVESPISRPGFCRLIRHWQPMGVWLSLWNADGELVHCDEDAGPIGRALRAPNSPLHDALADAVRLAVAEHLSNDCQITTDQQAMGPWNPDLGVLVAPIRMRRRCKGVVIGMFAMVKEPGDAIATLCEQNGIDLAEMAEFIGKQGTVPAGLVRSLAELLSLTVDQARETDTTGGEITVLTSNLENTYEELHLIYEISRRMDIPQNPLKMLEGVARDLLEVSRAAGIAFLLDGKTFPAESTDVKPEGGKTAENKGRENRRVPVVSRDDSILILPDRAVQVGPGAPLLEDLDRLANIASVRSENGKDYVLLNKADQQAELRWASTWLKHMVVLPLRHDDTHLGTCLAINCVDEGDFTSVDVQLLRAVADRVSAALQNQHLYDDLTHLLMGLVHALVNSVDAKDTYTFGHSERVAHFSRALARELGMSVSQCERVYLAGLLHDVGKIGVPDATLCKPGKLTDAEFEALKKHPEIGENILSHISQIRDLLPGVLYHHERMDGRGYPHKLAGRDIPLLGRIICLADSFDAMTTNRTYRAALPVSLAIAEISRCSGNQFDPRLSELFLGLDPRRLYEEAHKQAAGTAKVGRIGAISVALGGPPLPAAWSFDRGRASAREEIARAN